MSLSPDWSCELDSVWKSWGLSLWPCKEFQKYSYRFFFDQLFLAFKMCFCSVRGACNIPLSLFNLCFNWGGDGLVWTECEELKGNEIRTPRIERLFFKNEGSVSKPVQFYQWSRLKMHAEGLLHSSRELLQMLTWLICAKLQKFGLCGQYPSNLSDASDSWLYNQVNGSESNM